MVKGKKSHPRRKVSIEVASLRRENTLLLKELDFWRARYEEEKKRSDSLVNSLLQTNGLPSPAPVEATVVTHPPSSRREAIEKMMAELLNNEIVDTLEIAPEVAEAG